MGKVYGYIRISTKEQNEERQKIALKQVVVEKDNIFLERQSGKNFNFICSQWKEGNLSGSEAARKCKMLLSTFRYQAKQKGCAACR